jgi:hypothetical protein
MEPQGLAKGTEEERRGGNLGLRLPKRFKEDESENSMTLRKREPAILRRVS